MTGIGLETVLRVAGHAIPVTEQDVTDLAQRTAHKLQVWEIVNGPAGVELIVGDRGELVHLCHSDEAHRVGKLIQGPGDGATGGEREED